MTLLALSQIRHAIYTHTYIYIYIYKYIYIYIYIYIYVYIYIYKLVLSQIRATSPRLPPSLLLSLSRTYDAQQEMTL